MKQLLKALALFAAIAFVAGCDPVGPDNPDNPDNPAGDYFKLVSIYDSSKDAETLYIAGNAMGHYSMVVNTNLASDQYSATSSADWCKPVFEGGLLTINYEQYGGDHDKLKVRVAEVRVKAGSLYDKTFTIAQQSKITSLATINGQLEFALSPAGTPQDIYISTNLWDWQIENQTDWVVAEHVDRGTLRVSAKPKADDDNTSRSGMIYLYSVTYKSFSSDMDYDTYKIYFHDGEPELTGDGYGYGDHTDWD